MYADHDVGAHQNLQLDILTAPVFRPLCQPARFKGAHGGRGSGKSHFFAESLVEECVRVRGTRAVCLREVQKTLKNSSKTLIEDKIRKLGLQRAFHVLESHIETPGDGIIIFQGMQNHTADSIKSLEGFRISWFEEAQRCSAHSLSLLRPTLRVPGAELWFSWNPNSKKDPIDAFFRGQNLTAAEKRATNWAPPPSSILVEANYWDNPWFPESLVDEAEYDRRRDPDRYAHVWGGKYRKHSQAAVFRNWRIGEESEFIDPKRPYYGCDWGFSSDPTVAVRCYIRGRELFVDREIWALHCEIDHSPTLFDRLDGKQMRKWPACADSARPETISYMNRHGYPNIVAAKKGAGSVEEGVEFLKSFDIVVHPDCKHVADELTEYSYKVDEKTEEVLPVLEDRKNHTIDALRYALESTRTSTYTLANIS